MTGPNIHIYQATPDHSGVLFNMVKNKAELEGLNALFTASPDKLKTMLERNNSKILLADFDGKPAAMTTYHLEESTFTGKTLLNIADLYTVPKFGDRGLAKALLKNMAQVAVDHGYIIQIGPVIGNTKPIEWYKKLSAEIVYDAHIMRAQDPSIFLSKLD